MKKVRIYMNSMRRVKKSPTREANIKDETGTLNGQAKFGRDPPSREKGKRKW